MDNWGFLRYEVFFTEWYYPLHFNEIMRMASMPGGPISGIAPVAAMQVIFNRFKLLAEYNNQRRNCISSIMGQIDKFDKSNATTFDWGVYEGKKEILKMLEDKNL